MPPKRGRRMGAGVAVGKHYPVSRFGTMIARYPTLTFFLSGLPYIFLLLVLLLAVDAQIDSSEATFRPVTHTSAIQYSRAEELETAWFARTKQGGAATIGALVNTLARRSKPNARIEVRYSVSSGSVLDAAPMEEVRRFEQEVLSDADVMAVCLTDNGWGQLYGAGNPSRCNPMVSLTTYLFPSNTTSFTAGGYPQLPNDGNGQVYQTPLGRVAQRMVANPNYRWFVDATFSASSPSSANSRSHLILGSPVYTDVGFLVDATELKKKQQTAAKAVARAVGDANARQSSVVISMSSTLLDEAVAQDASTTSLLYLCASVALLGVVVFIRTGSVFFGLIGAVFNILAFLSAMGVYGGLSGGSMPLLELAAAFLLVSLNVQSLLSIVDTFRHSGMMASSGRDNDLSVSQRISYCIRHAGVVGLAVQLMGLILFGLLASLDIAALRSVALFSLLLLAMVIYNTFVFHLAAVGFYHVHFSGNGRLRQRQIDARRRREVEGSRFRRNKALTAILKMLEENPLPGEVTYSAKRDMVASQKARHTNVATTHSVVKILAGLRDDTLKELREMVVPSIRRKGSAKEEGRRRELIAARKSAAHSSSGAYGGFEEGPAEGFEMGAFLEASEVQRAKGFTSSRMVPSNGVLHLSVGTLKQVPTEPESDSSEEAGERRSPRRAAQGPSLTAIQIGLFEATLADADIHVNRLLGEDLGEEVSSSVTSTASEHNEDFSDHEDTAPAQVRPQERSPSTQATVAIPIPDRQASVSFSPAPNSLRVSPQSAALANNASLVLSGSMSGSIRILSSFVLPTGATKLRAETERFIAKWSFVGNILICGRTPTSVTWTTSAPAMPFVAALLTTTLLGDNVEGYGTVHIPAAIRKKLKARTPLSDEAKAIKKKRMKWFSKLRRRWRDRASEPRRKWICCGRQVEEAREEKDARILDKTAKPPKYTGGERFVRGPYMRSVRLCMYPLVIVCVGIAALFSYFASEVGSLPYKRLDLVSGSLRREFDDAGVYLVHPTAPCDYCSNYYQAATAFRGTLKSEYATCAPQYGWEQHNLYVDTCGVCMGEDACYRCDGRGYAPGDAGSNLTVDACGLCRTQTATLPVSTCGLCEIPTSTCSQCQIEGTTTTFAGGPLCTTPCPAGCSLCNPFTGACDDSHDALTSSAACLGRGLDVGGNCSCYGAWTGNMCQFCRCANGGFCDAVSGVCSCGSAYAGPLCEHCSVGCSMGDVCQRNWTVAEILLPNCVAQECNDSEVSSGTICNACQPKLSAVVLSHSTALQCWGSGVGAWDGGQCRAYTFSSGPTTCNSCSGYWTGANCSSCPVAGGTCLPNGTVMACDKQLYNSAATPLASVPNTQWCNTCGVDVTCGETIMNVSVDQAKIPFRLFIQSSKTVNDAISEIQMHSFLLAVVSLARSSSASISALFPIAFLDFYNLRGSEFTDNSSTLATRILAFTTTTSRLPEVGFISTNNWYVAISGVVGCPLPCKSEDISWRMGQLQVALAREAAPYGLLSLSIQSNAWMDAVVGGYLHTILIKMTVIGFILVVCVLLGSTTSLFLTAFAAVAMGCCVAGTLAVMFWQDHSPNPANIVAYALVLCIPAQYSLYVTLQFVDKLEAETLTLFTGEAVVYTALKESLTRTAPSILTCTVATLAVGVVLLFSSLLPISQMAVCVMVATALACVSALVLLPALILFRGPVVSRRHPIFAVTFVVVGILASILVLFL